MNKIKALLIEEFWQWLPIFLEYIFFTLVAFPFAAVYAFFAITYTLPDYAQWVAIVACVVAGLVFSLKANTKEKAKRLVEKWRGLG